MCSKNGDTVGVNTVHVHLFVCHKRCREDDLGKGLVMARHVFYCVQLSFGPTSYVLIVVLMHSNNTR